MSSKAWEAHTRALLVWLPVAAGVAISVLHPASGVLSDSLADAGVAGAAVLVWAYAVAAVVEYTALGDEVEEPQWAGLAVSIPFGLVVFSSVDQPLLAESNDCHAYCFVHLAALCLYAFAEVAGLWRRKYSLRGLLPYAAALVALGIYYRTVVAGDDFDATDGDTLQRLRLVGALEICAFTIARALVAAA